MPNLIFHQLTAGTPDATDLFVFEDISVALVKKVTLADLASALGGSVTGDNAITVTGSNVQLGSSSSTGQPLLHHTFIYGNNTYTLNFNSLRVEESKGANVTAANNLTLGLDGNLFTITGNTQINAITIADWQAGSKVQFVFTGTPTVKHNTAGGAGTATILLAGASDYTAASGDVLALLYDGTNWHEESRKIVASVGGITANEGLIINPAGNVQLGSPTFGGSTLTSIRYINVQSFRLSMQGSTSGSDAVLDMTNTGSGSCLNATNNGSSPAIFGNYTGTLAGAIKGQSVTGFGIYGSTSGAGIPVLAFNDGGTQSALFAVVARSSTTAVTVASADQRNMTSGTAANGIGVQHDFIVAASTGNQVSNSFVSKWVDATNATRSVLFTIKGATNAVTDDMLKMGDFVTLTESSATTFASTTVATGKFGGGEITVTVTADDATDFQARTLRFVWAAVNKAGTTTITISTPEELAAISNGSTLAVTITAVDAGSGVVNFQANAVSSLTQTTLRCSYQMSKNF